MVADKSLDRCLRTLALVARMRIAQRGESAQASAELVTRVKRLEARVDRALSRLADFLSITPGSSLVVVETPGRADHQVASVVALPENGRLPISQLKPPLGDRKGWTPEVQAWLDSVGAEE